MTGEELLARAFLHETDHLYGKLYISHVCRAQARSDPPQNPQDGKGGRMGLGKKRFRASWFFSARPRSPFPHWNKRLGGRATTCSRWSRSRTGPRAGAQALARLP